MSTLTEIYHAALASGRLLLCGCSRDGSILCEEHRPKTVMCGDCQGQGKVSPWFRGPAADECFDEDCETCQGTGEVTDAE